MKTRTCCFTGHRHIPEEDYQRVKEKLEQTIIKLYNRGVIHYGAGGALGFDYEKRKIVRSKVLDAAEESDR